MKKRLIAILTVLIFMCSMVQISVFADSAVVLDKISNTTVGGSVTISGTSTLSEIVINVKDPNNIDFYYNVIRITEGNRFEDTITIPSDAVTGVYTVYTGSGKDYATAQFRVSSKSSGGGSGTTPSPTPTPTPSPTPSDVIEVKTPVLDTNKNVSATVSEKDITAALEVYDAITVSVAEVSGANSYTVELPAKIFVLADSSKSIEIETEVGTITVPGNMFIEAEIKDAEKVSFKIATADTSELDKSVQELVGSRPVIELIAFVDGKIIEWNNPDVLVSVSIPYNPTVEELMDPEHIVVGYIDNNGLIKVVPSGRYNAGTGRVTFTTSHFSKYAVAFVHKTFDDISEYPWAQKAIEVLASKGVIAGTSPTTYSPTAHITRADFLVLLTKTMGLTAKVDSNFKDIPADAYYYEAVGIAKKLGITHGVGNDMFAPNEKISRQDMFALIHRAMVIAGKDLEEGNISDISMYDDVEQIAPYAVDSIAALVKNGLVVGHNNKLTPKANTTRAEAAVLLYKLYYK